MRALMWLLRLVLFFLLFGFAVKNDQLASLKFFFGSEWQLPIVFIIVIAFAAGALLGVTATFGSLLRQRREISRLRKQIERAKRERAESPVPVAEVQAPETL
ncbi:MAG: LapA family protein [Azoarcus sp.]|jgi:uncharacterized integral membrane protein|nr:LapA family protein [Azoarcus sp.]MDD2874000.1 LapA family protein [Azoarcus sp.]MDX9837515.1 LapA family protein [Azoarcus sp.]